MNEYDIENAYPAIGLKADNFSCVLAYLIAKADPPNLKRLFKGFPEEVIMVCKYFGNEYKLVGMGERDAEAN